MLKLIQILGFVLILQQTAFSQSGTITGKVFDKAENQPISFATVTLFTVSDAKMIGGSLTDATGQFVIDKLNPGSYRLQVQFMGFESVTVDNISLARNQNLTLGDIKIGASAQLLQEIQVSGQRATTFHQIDKQVYKASQFQVATGGTGVDVLRNLPSVSVNPQGEISMRGSTGFTVMLNGKMVQVDPTLLLSQIPANAIENIEIITSPSAKYDADGKAGIINITTKQGLDDGLSLVVNAQGGLPSVENYDNKEKPTRYGTDATVNYKKGKWDVSLGGSYLRNDNSGRRVGDVNTTIGNRFTSFPSVGERSFDKYNQSVRAAVTFAPNKTNIIRGGFYHGIRTEYRLADIEYDNKTTDLITGNIIGRANYYNSNLVKKRGEFSIANLDFVHTFGNKSTLSVSGLLEHDKLSGYTKNRNLRSIESTDTLQYTLNTNTRPLRGYRLKADYGFNLGAGKVESGYQYRTHEDEGNFVYLQKNRNNGPFTFYPEFSGDVTLRNQVHAVYSQYSSSPDSRLSYTGGLRYEYSTRDLTIGQDAEPYTLNLSNLFPSANFLYKFNDNWNGKAGYSRRVQRTTSFELNPLPEREHSETLEQGDPNLLPEFINLSELGVIRSFGNGSIFATVYHQEIKNAVNRVNSVYADTILNRIYTNAGRARRWGIEAGVDVRPTDWWKVYLGGNMYDYRIKGNLFNNTVAVNNGSLVYSINANTNFSLSKTLNLQWNLNYLSARATAQGEDSRFFSPNASLKKTFMNGKLAATLQWQNMDMGLLRTNEQRITTRGTNFFTTTNYIYEVDVFLVNISYNLNQLSRKNKFTESEFGEKEF
jgi:ferric enterobactin receptor